MEGQVRKILVVDDQEGMRLTLAGSLELEGHTVMDAEDGYRALELVKQHEYDIIFMDIRMPGINGVETFLKIREIRPTATVIMMTAYAVEDLVETALEKGAFTVLHKPFKIAEVIDVIERALSGKLILIVDDSYQERHLLKTLLVEKGYAVETASDGEEAIRKVQRGNIDICILDVVLPKMNGFLVYESMLKVAPAISVIFVTGYDVPELIDKATAGGYVCIRKPVKLGELVDIVEKARARRAPGT